MLTSTDHVLTTHTGSLPRPAGLTPGASGADVAAAVAEVVRHQLAVGLDVINDGEAGKSSETRAGVNADLGTCSL